VRLVSLTCSNTEIVWALGEAASLVGVDNHSDFPAEVVARLPRVGPDLDIDVERVARLEPDLVLASLTVPGHERIVERLERARLPFMVTEPVSLADVYADVRQIGHRLGVSGRAEAVVTEMRSSMAPATTDGAARPSILVEWWPKPVIVPGRLSWVTEMIAASGGRGPLDDEDVKSRPITDDEARAFDPDAVVIAWCGVPFEKYRPEIVRRREAWRGVRAVRENRIFAVPEAYLGRPGPRLGLGLRELRRIVTDVQSSERSPMSSS
jgi:iron complex transport system substrate-binding protein